MNGVRVLQPPRQLKHLPGMRVPAQLPGNYAAANTNYGARNLDDAASDTTASTFSPAPLNSEPAAAQSPQAASTSRQQAAGPSIAPTSRQLNAAAQAAAVAADQKITPAAEIVFEPTQPSGQVVLSAAQPANLQTASMSAPNGPDAKPPPAIFLFRGVDEDSQKKGPHLRLLGGASGVDSWNPGKGRCGSSGGVKSDTLNK